MHIYELALEATRDCLPPEHPQKAALTAKAQNRRGDCLLILGDARADFATASDAKFNQPKARKLAQAALP